MVSMTPTWSERRFLPLPGPSPGFIHSATRPPGWLPEAGEVSAAPAPCSVRPLHQDENLRASEGLGHRRGEGERQVPASGEGVEERKA